MGNGISSALDPTRGRGVISIPEGYTTPRWPSLYIPTIDSTEDQRGIFLYEAEAIWHYTLYWTLLFDCSLFLICSVLASFTLALSVYVFRPAPPPPIPPPVPPSNMTAPKPAPSSASSDTPPYPPCSPRTATTANTPITPMNSAEAPLLRKIVERPKRKRPPLWPILILPLVAISVAGVIAVITGTVMGFALAAVYSAGGFSMSTWVPFLWALIQVLVLIISSYSTLTSIL
ncbi:hypothetical protein IAT38_006600 [Cryptococcus sp. DSM 104549]